CDNDAQSFEVRRFEMKELAFRITDVSDRRARREAWTEFLDNSFDERILPARRERHPFSRRQLHRDTRQVALALHCLTDLCAVCQIFLQLRRPRPGSKGTH